MSKDEPVGFLKRDPIQTSSAALDLISGLESRCYGRQRQASSTAENIEFYAEEQFIRKLYYDEMRCEMPGLPRSTFLMVFSPDGSRVASTHGNHNIYITDIRTGKNIRTLVGHPRTPWCIAFHPKSNQIVASGCLGGQVRIWDLSGGNEVWQTVNQTVIASLAFHPTERVLVIATYNEVHFWDWSHPEPFVHIATGNPKEKVRFVAFDALGHKLITGISNSPQTRWERVRAPVPVPRQERSVNLYRRRITPRMLNYFTTENNNNINNNNSTNSSTSSALDRERRITMCYRNLVREYELLVQRYLQLYRQPLMIDVGTDPMETIEQSRPGTSSSAQSIVNLSRSGPSSAPQPSTSSAPEPGPGTDAGSSLANDPGPSTSGISSRNARVVAESISSDSGTEDCGWEDPVVTNRTRQENPPTSLNARYLTPSRIFSVLNEASMLLKGNQTLESRKHKATETNQTEPKGKRLKRASPYPSPRFSNGLGSSGAGEPPEAGRPSTSGASTFPSAASEQPSTSGLRTVNPLRSADEGPTTSLRDVPGPSTSTLLLPSTSSGRRSGDSVDQILCNIRRTAEEEVQNRILPIICSVPPNDRPELIRLFENSKKHIHMRYRSMFPVVVNNANKRVVNVVDTSSDSSSSDDDQSMPLSRLLRRKSESLPLAATSIATRTVQNLTTTTISGTNAGTGNLPVGNDGNVRNFNMELEQLVTSLLTEIERNEADRANGARSNLTGERSNEVPYAVTGTPPPPDPPTVITTTEQRQQPVSISTSAPVAGPTSRLVYPRPFQGFFPRFNLVREATARGDNVSRYLRALTFEGSRYEAPSINDLRAYGNCLLRRKRLLSHRMSAFMPTRVNYNRTPVGMRRVGHSWNRRRPGLPRPFGTVPPSSSSSATAAASSFGTDELINYSERENSEDDSTPQPLDLSNHTTLEEAGENGGALGVYSDMRINSAFSYIVHDLESNLSDVIRMRASNRPGETSVMLDSLSERLNNIMEQSDVILRNLSSSMELGSTAGEPSTQRAQGAESGWSYYDQNFFARDQRANGQDASRDEPAIHLGDIFNYLQPSNAVAADHTYPRNPENGHSTGQSDNRSSLMTSLHMAISHIQRQARLLRRQVERIERIDRAMVEVAQLQLIRQLIIELVRHIRNNIDGNEGGVGGESGSTTTGMSSVRQMMAGTRISDSSPYESPLEDAGGSSRTNPQSSSGTVSDANALGTASGDPGVGRSGPRSSNRKTYPCGRFMRRSRQSRNPPMIHFFSRRYVHRGDRSAPRPNGHPRSVPLRHAFGSSPTRLNAFTLQAMSRRLQLLLMSQVRGFTSPPSTTGTNLRSPSPGAGEHEHLLATSLLDCVSVVNRLTGSNINPSSVRNLTVTQDGELRYRARRILTGIIETMSRHIEELGFSSIRSIVREQFHGVIVMSLLLTELQLLVIVDSIPPPNGGNLIPERVSLTSRIDQMCNQMLQSRNFTHSHQLTRSLRLMKLTMQHAHSALGQTYLARRNEMLPRINTSRQQVLGSINRCLLFINRQRNSETASTSGAAAQTETPENTEWYSNFYDFFLRRYSNDREEDSEVRPQPSTSRERSAGQSSSRPNDNGTDGDDDDDDNNTRFNQNNNNSNYNNNVSGNYTDVQLPYVRYRHCNLNMMNGAPLQQSRLIPSVQLNDVPVSEPETSNLMNHHRRNFSERLSELRTHPIRLIRPRFLHSLYASVMNPFDADLDDPQREPLYENDMITTVTPNHRIQAWDIADWTMPLPQINDGLKNVVVSECKIHNDASVDVAKDGTILVTLLPSGGYLNVTNRLGVYSLRWETLGQCLYTTSFEQNAVSVSLSPLSRHLVVGLTHRVITSDRWVMAKVFKIEQKDVPGDRLPVLKELEQNRECRINCIRWLPTSGQGLIYATNTGQLVVLS